MNSPTSQVLHCEIQGKGKNVVLIHGFLESNSMWKPLCLHKNFRVIEIELPGHGLSPMPNEQLTIPSVAKMVKETLDDQGVQEYNLIGHSLGGYVALEVLAQFGIHGKLILLHSNFWQDNEEKQQDRQRVAKIVLKNKDLFLQEAIPRLFLEPKKQFAAINNLLSEAKEMNSRSISEFSIAMKNRNNHEETVRKNAEKITIIQGENDKVVAKDLMLKMLRKTNVELHVIPQCGHMGHHEQTDLVRKKIVTTLEQGNSPLHR